MYGLVVFETITTFLYFLKIREVALQNTNCLYEECRLFAGPWIPRKPWKPWKSIIFLEKTLRTFRIFFMVRIFSVCFYSLSCTRNYLVFKFLTGSSNKPWKVTKSWNSPTKSNPNQKLQSAVYIFFQQYNLWRPGK